MYSDRMGGQYSRWAMMPLMLAKAGTTLLYYSTMSLSTALNCIQFHSEWALPNWDGYYAETRQFQWGV